VSASLRLPDNASFVQNRPFASLVSRLERGILEILVVWAAPGGREITLLKLGGEAVHLFEMFSGHPWLPRPRKFRISPAARDCPDPQT